MTFHVYEKNPIIAADKECRDPNMFWHEKSGKWILVLAAALEKGNVDIFLPDLKNWTKESSFGHGYGAQEGVWECPDLMELPVRGNRPYQMGADLQYQSRRSFRRQCGCSIL